MKSAIENDEPMHSGKCIPSSSKSQQVLAEGHESFNTRFVSDRERLLGILPEEVWQLVFEKIEHFDDLEKVRNCSGFFRQLLLAERVKTLFHNVWKILSSSGYLSSYETDKKGALQKDELNLRLVCQSWSKVIDKMCEDRPILLCSSCPSSWTKILPKFEATHGSSTIRNPFIVRSVSIEWEERESNEFIIGLLSILDKYGHHFWQCTIDVQGSVTTCYSKLGSTLERMQNLKTVEIIVSRLIVWEVQELEAEANANPLPFLKQIKFLSVENLPTEICHQLFCTNRHISNVKIATASLMKAVNINKSIIGVCGPLSSLKTLSCNLGTRTDFLVMNSPHVNWPLAKLHLDLSKCPVDWQTVFTVLGNKFKSTLVELDLELPLYTGKQGWKQKFYDGKKLNLDISNLSVLKLEMYDFVCLDFLLPMRNLRNLEITVLKNDQDKDINRVEKVGYAESGNGCVLKAWSCIKTPLESNVWTMMPKLEIFCCKTVIPGQKFLINNTRRDWKMMMNERLAFAC